MLNEWIRMVCISSQYILYSVLIFQLFECYVESIARMCINHRHLIHTAKAYVSWFFFILRPFLTETHQTKFEILNDVKQSKDKHGKSKKVTNSSPGTRFYFFFGSKFGYMQRKVKKKNVRPGKYDSEKYFSPCWQVVNIIMPNVESI